MLSSDEQTTFTAILENQRNVAMTELARIAARNAALEQALAEAAVRIKELESVGQLTE